MDESGQCISFHEICLGFLWLAMVCVWPFLSGLLFPLEASTLLCKLQVCLRIVAFDISGAQVQREKERWVNGTFWIKRGNACNGLGVHVSTCVCFCMHLFVYSYLNLYL